MKKGLLLLNLGTPDCADIPNVRRYLREFLSDKRVIDLPIFLRYLLLYAVILPFRPKQAAHAYQAIWTTEGSPLRVYSLGLVTRLQACLPENYQVALGMRYGNPSIATALKQLANCDELIVLPLYPQYSSAATGSSIENVLRTIAIQNTHPNLTIIRDFYQDRGFINAQATLIKPYLDADYFLFSYHGIPERHLIKSGCLKVCKEPCNVNIPYPLTCYRAQCYDTSARLANVLNLSTKRYTTSFQSRLGRTPWIKPYTDLVLPQLAQQGIKRLVITCPSFVADCLETLEEIGVRARLQWQQLGGESLTLIPCVNDSDGWVNAIIKLCRLDV
jgi:ferrochelatase